MRIRILLLLVLFPAILHAQVMYNRMPYNLDYYKLFFTDENTGFATTTGQGEGSCNPYGYMLKTIDGGKHWIKIPTGYTEKLYSVYFVNKSNGWATGQNGRVIKTTDGGYTWTSPTGTAGAGFNDIFFTDINNGYVVGADGLIRRTTNGGTTWTTVAGSGASPALNAVYCTNATTAYAVGLSGTIRKTTNGTTWTTLNSGVSNISLNGVYFTDANIGYAVGYGAILKTKDAGATWSVNNSFTDIGFKSVYFTDSQNGYVVGYSGVIFKTNDAGVNWTQMTSNTIRNLNSIFFVNGHTGYICGDNGSIWKTMNGKDWKNQTTGYAFESSGFNLALTSVYFTDSTSGYVTTSSGHITRTDNRGLNWKHQPSSNKNRLNCIAFPMKDTGWVAGHLGTILFTKNGGEDWETQSSGTKKRLVAIQFLDTKNGYITGDSGTILKTVDGGITWLSKNVTTIETIESVFFQNPTIGYAVSTYGKIYKTTDGANSWQVTNVSAKAGNLKAIFFANDSVGYAGGTSTTQKLIITKNRGLSWDTIGKTGNSFVKLYFMTPAKGYMGNNQWVYETSDSGKTWSSKGVGCAVFSEITGMSFPDANHAFVSGGYNSTSYLNKYTTYADINEVHVSQRAICAGSTAEVGFVADPFINSGNIYTAQLSDETGSFANPTTIGTATGIVNGFISLNIPAGTPSGTGYRVRVLASNPVIVSKDNGYDITISNSLTPSVSIFPVSKGACPGQTAELVAEAVNGGIKPSYLWKVNSISSGLNSSAFSSSGLNNNDVITVELTSTLTCKSISTVISPDFVFKKSNVIAETGSDQTICNGTKTQLGGNGGIYYHWSPTTGLDDPEISNPIVTIHNSIVYILTVTDENGCTGTDNVTINVVEPPDATFTVNGNLLTATASGTGINYQWIKDNVAIEDETNSTYLVSESGDYSLKVDDGLCQQTSSNVQLIITGLNELFNSSLSIYPSPSTGIINIETKNLEGQVQVYLYNTSGLVVKKLSMNDSSNEKISMDCGELPKAIYHLVIMNNDKIYNENIVLE